MRHATLSTLVALAAVGMWLQPRPAAAELKKCPKDSVTAGDLCMDTYEASVWEVPDPTGANKKLVKKIQGGKIKELSQLTEAGAVQRGLGIDDYAPCADDGVACGQLFAVSLPGLTPSSNLTWFQAQQACANSGKALPTNAQWQQAAGGSPDFADDNGTTMCKTAAPAVAVPTGSRSLCHSVFGTFDMVGNLWEWTADWVVRSTGAPGWGAASDDLMSLSGAAVSAGGPGALMRGGAFDSGASAGPLAVQGGLPPQTAGAAIGFRCVR